MIGTFVFSADPAPPCIMLELAWRGGARIGRVVAPKEVMEKWADCLALREGDDYLQLPLALGYAVTVASTVRLPLTVSGDRSAWAPSFGRLKDVPGAAGFH